MLILFFKDERLADFEIPAPGAQILIDDPDDVDEDIAAATAAAIASDEEEPDPEDGTNLSTSRADSF